MKDEMLRIRRAAGLTQAQMQQLMGLGDTAYAYLERGRRRFHKKHELMLDRVSLSLAVERGDLSIATESVRQDLLGLKVISVTV